MDYPYEKTINGDTIQIEGPLSIVTVDEHNYEIVDEVGRGQIDTLNTDYTAFKDKLTDIFYYKTVYPSCAVSIPAHSFREAYANIPYKSGYRRFIYRVVQQNYPSLSLFNYYINNNDNTLIIEMYNTTSSSISATVDFTIGVLYIKNSLLSELPDQSSGGAIEG